MQFPRWLTFTLVGLMVLGVVFRFVNLNHKVYWHDEVYTTMRAAGYTRAEIDRDLFQDRLIVAGDLQRYQQIKPGSTAMDTVRSLALEDPQHPPLYFLLTRVWMQALGAPLTAWFNSPLTVMRSLPVLISLLALPAMYGLMWELFGCQALSLLGTTLVALSPYDVLFAQTARQYSLLTVMVIVSSWLLLRALRVLHAHIAQSPLSRKYTLRQPRHWINWGLYSLSVAIGLYTQPFFALTIASQMVYVGLCCTWDIGWQRCRRWTFAWMGSALAIAGLLASPWLWVIATNVTRANATTDWTRVFPGFDYLVKLWTLSFTSLFVDLDFGFTNPWTILLRLPFVALIAVSLYVLCQRTKLPTWLWVVCTIAVPFLLLAIPDLVLGGKRSAVSRYLVSCYPGIQVAVAYFLGNQLASKRIYSRRSPGLLPAHSAYSLRSRPAEIWQAWVWRGALGLLVLASITSLTVSALSNSWWNKDVSFPNDQTADWVNQTSNPVLLSDIGDDYTNTGDLISLSYRLKPDTPLFLIQNPNIVMQPEIAMTLQGKTAIAFRPSSRLKQRLEQQFGILQQLPPNDHLYAISPAITPQFNPANTSQKNTNPKISNKKD